MGESLMFYVTNVTPTKTPGLYIHPMPFLPGRWGITHKPSGKSIANFESQEKALMAANAIGKRFGSFNYTEDKVKNWPAEKRTAIRLFILEHGGSIGGRSLETTEVRLKRLKLLEERGIDEKSNQRTCPNCGVTYR